MCLCQLDLQETGLECGEIGVGSVNKCGYERYPLREMKPRCVSRPRLHGGQNGNVQGVRGLGDHVCSRREAEQQRCPSIALLLCRGTAVQPRSAYRPARAPSPPRAPAAAPAGERGEGIRHRGEPDHRQHPVHHRWRGGRRAGRGCRVFLLVHRLCSLVLGFGASVPSGCPYGARTPEVSGNPGPYLYSAPSVDHSSSGRATVDARHDTRSTPRHRRRPRTRAARAGP